MHKSLITLTLIWTSIQICGLGCETSMPIYDRGCETLIGCPMIDEIWSVCVANGNVNGTNVTKSVNVRHDHCGRDDPQLNVHGVRSIRCHPIFQWPFSCPTMKQIQQHWKKIEMRTNTLIFFFVFNLQVKLNIFKWKKINTHTLHYGVVYGHLHT